MATMDEGHRQTNDASRQGWKSLVDELRKTTDVQRMRELVMLLEQAIFNRQQELALNAAKIDQHEVEKEEKSMKGALDLLLDVKAKKLGFPDIR